MAYRTMTFKHLFAHKARQPDSEHHVLAALPDGSDFTDLCHQVLQEMSERGADIDHAKRTFRQVTAVQRFSDGVLATVETGSMGDVPLVRDVRTGAASYQLTEYDAPAVTLRCAIVVPQGSRSAIACIEHGNHRSADQNLLKEIHTGWVSTQSGLTLQIETVVQSQDWITMAQLEAVTAVVYGHRADIADQGRPAKLGTMQYHLIPDKGERYLPAALKQRLMNRDLSRARVLGLRSDLDIDEVTLTLSDDGQRKTVVLGHERTPTIRLVLSEPDQEPLADQSFVRYSQQEARRTIAAMNGSHP
jgi:hypothetical protein